MPIFISKPHCLDCDPEYFKNVSGYHPERKKHETWSAMEPVSSRDMCMHNILYVQYVCLCSTTPMYCHTHLTHLRISLILHLTRVFKLSAACKVTLYLHSSQQKPLCA